MDTFTVLARDSGTRGNRKMTENPQHEYIMKVFGENTRIRYNESHFWQREPCTIAQRSMVSTEPVIARLTNPNELIIDIGDEILNKFGLKKNTITIELAEELYPSLRDEAKQVKAFLDKQGIPYWLGFQGRGFHFHVFINQEGKEFKNKFIQWLKKESKVNDICEDVNNKEPLPIREFGSQHEKCFFTAYKTLLNDIPESFPRQELLEPLYPESIKIWEVPQEILNQIQAIKTKPKTNKNYFKNNLWRGFVSCKKIKKLLA